MSGKAMRKRIWVTARKSTRQFTALVTSGLVTLLVGCSAAQFPNGNGGGGGGTGNVAAISVNGGPFSNSGNPYANGAFTSVTICVPGSTSQCQTIDGILVDTGSYGLRIEGSALTLSLPQQMDGSGNPIVECAEFGSGFAWGPVQTADFTISGESAKSLPVHIMGSASFPDTDGGGASTCATADSTTGQSLAGTSSDYDVAENLGANGILGVGNFAQDCGTACTQSTNNPGFYYSCPTADTCAVTTEATTSQVVNPVAMFATDNNGVIIKLPSLTGGLGLTVNGSLIFGIGTQTNNGLGSAMIYDVDPSVGNFTTVFNSTTYSDEGFVDSGSNAFYFLDSTTTGLPQCSDITFLYCPTSSTSLSATNEGFSNGNSGTVDFTIDNADSLLSNTSDNAFGTIGGPGVNALDGSLYFDWGLPFFYGVNVYTAIDGANTPAGPGPYVAY